MIDYIKILKIVVNKINDTIQPHTDELNNKKFEPTEDPKLRKPILIHNILNHVGLIAIVMPLFIMFVYWVVTPNEVIANAIHKHTFILFGIICIIIVGIILLSIDVKINKKLNETIYEMTRQHDKYIWKTKKNIEITKTKELLKDFTGEKIEDKDVDSLMSCHYYGSSNIPVKGNLYQIPLKTMLQTTNVKSIQNLYKNIEFLYNYYLKNYVEDDQYTWITKQLNAFYNGNITENIDSIELLKNLKN